MGLSRAWVLIGVILLLPLAAGCAPSPAPAFFGAERKEITLDGIRFVVWHKGDHAEVVRLGYLTRKERDKVPARMILAVEQVTGCQVVQPGTGWWRSPSLVGDTGEARFELACDAPPPAKS